MSERAAPEFIKEAKDWAQALSVTVQVIHRDHQDQAEAVDHRDQVAEASCLVGQSLML